MTKHNLNIHMYSLKELIEDIFHLEMPLTLDSLKRAKRVVVQIHPDKSRLPPEYFLFYKRAFEMVVDFYQSEHKQNQVITEDTTTYVADMGNEAQPVKTVTKALGEISSAAFQKKFNQLFEENQMGARQDTSRNQWFTSADAQYAIPEQVSSKNMGAVFETIKTTKLANQLVVRPELDTIKSASGTKLYEEDDDGEYVSSDPFSKLKFEDLRKVHRDQTIFAVGATTHTLPQNKTAEQFARERSQQVLSPMERAEADRILAAKEAARQERLWAFQHNSNLRALENEKKNQSVLSAFLQLRN